MSTEEVFATFNSFPIEVQIFTSIIIACAAIGMAFKMYYSFTMQRTSDLEKRKDLRKKAIHATIVAFVPLGIGSVIAEPIMGLTVTALLFVFSYMNIQLFYNG